MKKLWIAAAALLTALAVGLGAYEIARLPETVTVAGEETFVYRQGLLTARPEQGEVQAAAALGPGGSYTATLRLFDRLPLKTVRVRVGGRRTVTVLGTPFGVRLFTEGVIVVGFGTVRTAAGDCCPAREAGIQAGDNLLTVGGVAVGGNSELAAIVRGSGGRPVPIVLERGGERSTVYLQPAAARDGSGYKAGMWVRDSTAGIGTATFYDEATGLIAGLGHAIADTDTGVVMPVAQGELVEAAIVGAVKGARGAPGELKGVLSGGILASLLTNEETGIFGRVTGSPPEGSQLPVAYRQEIAEGDAQLLCTINGQTPQLYTCEIERVYLASRRETQNMIVRVTDSRLLAAAGGIVQGMSGSPIVQNGSLVGAVTHVFVGDPTRGYGIFAENMLEKADAAAAREREELPSAG